MTPALRISVGLVVKPAMRGSLRQLQHRREVGAVGEDLYCPEKRIVVTKQELRSLANPARERKAEGRTSSSSSSIGARVPRVPAAPSRIRAPRPPARPSRDRPPSTTSRLDCRGGGERLLQQSGAGLAAVAAVLGTVVSDTCEPEMRAPAACTSARIGRVNGLQIGARGFPLGRGRLVGRDRQHEARVLEPAKGLGHTRDDPDLSATQRTVEGFLIAACDQAIEDAVAIEDDQAARSGHLARRWASRSARPWRDPISKKRCATSSPARSPSRLSA